MRKLRFLALLLTLSIVLASCGSGEKPGASGPASGTSGIGASDQDASGKDQAGQGVSDPESSVGESASGTVATPTDTPTPTPTDTPTPTPTPTPTEILISFIGDTTLGEQRDHAGAPYCFTSVVGDNFAYPFSKALPYLEADDMTLCNLEGPLTKSENLRPEREIYLKGDPKYVQVLKEASIECVNLANNHTYDYMDEGLNETRRVLEENGILWSDSTSYAIYETKGVKIGMAGFSFTLERDPYYRAIEWLREQGCAIVIISSHIGVERMYEPEQSAIELAHDILDYGADIYVGSHPHRLQPVDYYNGKYIIYSESNFCFGGQPWLSDPDTAIFQCTFTVDEGHLVGSRMECIPFSMRSTSEGNDYCPMPYEKGSDEYARVMQKLHWSDANE